MKTLEGHEDNVRVLAVGDRHVFSGSWDKTIRVWDLETLECTKVHQCPPISAPLRPVGALLGNANGGLQLGLCPRVLASVASVALRFAADAARWHSVKTKWRRLQCLAGSWHAVHVLV